MINTKDQSNVYTNMHVGCGNEEWGAMASVGGGFLGRLTPWLANFLIFTMQMPITLDSDPLEIQKSSLENILATPLVRLSVVQKLGVR